MKGFSERDYIQEEKRFLKQRQFLEKRREKQEEVKKAAAHSANRDARVGDVFFMTPGGKHSGAEKSYNEEDGAVKENKFKTAEDIVSTSIGTGNPEEEMIGEEEANERDPFAEHNNDPKEIAAGINLDNIDHESEWEHDENDWESFDKPDFEMDSSMKKLETEKMKYDVEEDKGSKENKTSQEIKTTERGKMIEKIADKKEFAFLRAPSRGFNSKYPGKDNPKGLEQIKTKSSVRKFWNKLTGKE